MIRFALVGCGRIAKRHAEILGNSQIPGASLSAVCDMSADRAREYGDRYKVPYFTSLAGMLAERGAEIDVVSILTPSGLHAGQAIEAAAAGKHVVTEKPMALTLSDADEMIAACRRAGTRLFVVKQNRYNLPVQHLRRAVESGRFGRLVLGTVRVRWCRRQDYYDQDSWRGTWAMDGGVFANQASHHVDLLQWLMGPVESVNAKATTALVNIQAEDTGVALVKFRNGALGVIEATTAARPVDLEGSVSILGERGTVEIGGFAVNKMKTWQFQDASGEDKAMLDEYSENPPNVYGYGHVRYLDQVVNCLVSGRPSPVDGEEGRRSLEVIAAIYESIATQSEVRLPCEPTKSLLGRR